MSSIVLATIHHFVERPIVLPTVTAVHLLTQRAVTFGTLTEGVFATLLTVVQMVMVGVAHRGVPLSFLLR